MADIIEPIGIPEFYVDGFDEHELQNGHVITCLGYRDTKSGRVAVVKLTFPASAAQAAIDRAKAAMDGKSASPHGLLVAEMCKRAN